MKRLRILAAVLGLAGAVGASLVAQAHSRPRLQPPTAYVCQEGPGVPIANGKLYQMDIETGAMTELGLPVCDGCPLAYDPVSGKIIGFNDVNSTDNEKTRDFGLYDLTTLPGTLIGTFKAPGARAGLSRDPTTGKWYALTEGARDSYLYEIDITNANARFIGHTWGVSVSGMSINSRGEAFAAEEFEFKRLYRVDLTTGRLTSVGPLNTGITGGHPTALCFDSLDTLWMLTGGTTDQHSRLFTVDTTTGQATSVRFTQVSGWYAGLVFVP